MDKALRLKKIIQILKRCFPENKKTARKKDPFWVLIATIISQRTKDETTDLVVKRLKKRVKKQSDILFIPEDELQRLLFPSGFYKSKAKTIKQVAEVIFKHYKGKVPDSIEELLKIKGVGRKTANIVISEGYGKLALPVDTHVHRVSNRLGIVATKTPEDTEFTLRKIVPERYWNDYSRLLVNFGKLICKPFSPLCSKCQIEKICPKIGVERQR